MPSHLRYQGEGVVYSHYRQYYQLKIQQFDKEYRLMNRCLVVQ